jgi:hypothetical protein
LANQALSRGLGKVSLGEKKPMVFSPYIISILSVLAIAFISSLNENCSRHGKRLIISKTALLSS